MAGIWLEQLLKKSIKELISGNYVFYTNIIH